MPQFIYTLYLCARIEFVRLYIYLARYDIYIYIYIYISYLAKLSKDLTMI